MLLRAVTEPFI